jgi:alpha,alpha-trehalase
MIEIAQQHASSMQLAPDFESAAIDALTKEHSFWSSSARSVTLVDTDGMKHTLSRYNADWTNPRPESFKYGP